MKLLERLALVSYREPLPPDPEHPGNDYYEVMGILPMLWQWTRDSWSYAAHDLGITVGIIADDHPRIARVIKRGRDYE